MTVAAIILAAGASTRLGHPKQLLKFHGESLLQRAIRVATESGASPVFTVLGANAELIRASIQPGNSISVINDEWGTGMASSIHVGLRAMVADALDASGALLMSCDQPLLTADYLRSLLAEFEAQALPGIVCAVPPSYWRASANGLYGV